MSLSLSFLLSSKWGFPNSLINDLKKYILTFLLNWNKTNQSPTSHCDMIFLIDFLSSALWVLPHQQSLHIRIYDLIGSKNIVTIRYIMPKGVMIAIKNVIQNHKAKYIFWLILFWVSIHKWFLFSWPPAVPTSGTEQLKNMNV